MLIETCRSSYHPGWNNPFIKTINYPEQIIGAGNERERESAQSIKLIKHDVFRRDMFRRRRRSTLMLKFILED